MIHTLKTINPFFQQVVDRIKKFEIRKNDRGFQVNDIVKLCEYDDEYTGRSVTVRIEYILHGDDAEKFGLMKEYCIFSFEIMYLE